MEKLRKVFGILLTIDALLIIGVILFGIFFIIIASISAANCLVIFIGLVIAGLISLPFIELFIGRKDK